MFQFRPCHGNSNVKSLGPLAFHAQRRLGGPISVKATQKDRLFFQAFWGCSGKPFFCSVLPGHVAERFVHCRRSRGWEVSEGVSGYYGSWAGGCVGVFTLG